VIFLDSDDYWAKEKLEKQLTFMVENGSVFSYTQYNRTDEKDAMRPEILTGPDVVTESLMFRYCYVGCLTVMYKTDAIGLIQIDERIGNGRNDYCCIYCANCGNYGVCRLSVSEYLRQIAMKKQPKELPSEEMIQSLMRLRNVISHFEQRARSASDEEQIRFFMSCAEYIRMIMTDTLQLMSHSKPKAEVKNGND
jgi:hypothetical protein